MADTYTRQGVYRFQYSRSADQDAPAPVRHPLVVVGAGPVGLAAAIDLAQRGHAVVLLDDADRIGEGSRGLCYSKRALEILDTLGCGEAVAGQGVQWKIGKVHFRDQLVYEFDLLPEDGHKMPAFVNLQQFYLEKHLVERARQLPGIDLRWSNKVTSLELLADGARAVVETPEGPYAIEADWLIAADGAKSSLREMLGLDFIGETFRDRFLIADIRMEAEFPAERRFWFEPPFHDGQSTLLHKQPDDVWRIDFQIGWDADPDEEMKPERVRPRLDRMLEGRAYDIVWCSVYTFQCRRMANFVHGRVLFAGDAAHQVSPFGARGANSGFGDAQNLAWKLDLLLRGEAGERLVDSYSAERIQAAEENIGHSTHSTDFMVPKSKGAEMLRNAVLDLARTMPFARRMVNSGRLHMPERYASPLTTADDEAFAGSAALGLPAPDAEMQDADGAKVWLLNALSPGFNLLAMAGGALKRELATKLPAGVALTVVGEDLIDAHGYFKARFDATPGACYLLRPDHYLCARWRQFDADKLARALARAKGDL